MHWSVVVGVVVVVVVVVVVAAAGSADGSVVALTADALHSAAVAIASAETRRFTPLSLSPGALSVWVSRQASGARRAIAAAAL